MTNLNNIIEILAKQALGGQQQSNQQIGLGGILGSVLGQLGASSTGQTQQDGLGGILGSVLGGLTGGQSQHAPNSQNSGFSGGGKSLLIAVLPLILAWIQQQGGLQAALDKLKGQGLSSQVEDWVSTVPGENASVNPEQVKTCLMMPRWSKSQSKRMCLNKMYIVRFHKFYHKLLILSPRKQDKLILKKPMQISNRC